MKKFEYKVIHKDTAPAMTLEMNLYGGVKGYKLIDFKYSEYLANVKSEGLKVMQSYVAVMEREIDV